MNVVAVVVWYNPDEKNRVNITSYIPFVEKAYIIDNSENDNSKYLTDIPLSEKIVYIPNFNNYGIATAQNMACKKAYEEGYSWALLMDQDSYFVDSAKTYREKADEEYRKDPKIALFSPNIFPYKVVSGNQTKVISSGSLINLYVWNKCGKFVEKLFIDEVDTEYCYRLRKNGYCIQVINEIRMQHKIGEPCTRKIGPFIFNIQNHNYIRIYYIIRNRLYLMKNYFTFSLFFEYTKYNLRDLFYIVFFEKDKERKIKAYFKGFCDFIFSKYGRYK